MNRVIYFDKRTFEKYDNTRYIVYLNEEILEDYIPEVMEGQSTPAPVTAFAYTGPVKDGGTLIEATSADRDSLINGIIRSRYSQSEEDAIKTHQIELLKDDSIEKAAQYEQEWKEFNTIRDIAKQTVDCWLANRDV